MNFTKTIFNKSHTMIYWIVSFYTALCFQALTFCFLPSVPLYLCNTVTLSKVTGQSSCLLQSMHVFVFFSSVSRTNSCILTNENGNVCFILKVCSENQRFEKLMEHFRNEDNNIDFMVFIQTHIRQLPVDSFKPLITSL